MLKLGVIMESKTPPDARVPLTPRQASFVQRNFPVEIIVQSSPTRSFKDEEYAAEGIVVKDNIEECDVFLGIKEVRPEKLIPDKTYFFFSHTLKKQAHNLPLLKEILLKRITLVDYEALTDDNGTRLIAFGRYAGMVGAHNGILAYGIRTSKFELPRMKDLLDYSKARTIYQNTPLPNLKIAVTGTGRVSTGALTVLRDWKIQQVSHNDYLTKKYKHPVFTQLSPMEYAERKDGKTYSKPDYYAHPERYKSAFAPYFQKTDLFINGIYYDKLAPLFFSTDDMRRKDFRIQTIADISCDIVPLSSLPCTLRATSIEKPFFGYDPITEKETQPFLPNVVDMMAVDNLPNELPRDASEFFSEQFIVNILPELIQGEESLVIERATITKNGVLTEPYDYLKDFVEGIA